MAQGKDYQQTKASESWPSLFDPQTTPGSFNILAGQGQDESFQDIFDLLSNNVEIYPPQESSPPLPPPQPQPLNFIQENNEREPQKKLFQDSSRGKRPSQAHNLIERRRRTKIQENLNTLKQLIPNCKKTNRVATLEDVIEYIKSLQKQVETINTMGIPVMPAYMGGAGGQQNMQMPFFPSPLPPLVPMTPVMGMGFGMGVYGSPSYSPTFIPSLQSPFPLSLSSSSEFAPNQPQMPLYTTSQIHPAATLTSAISMATTKAHDIGSTSFITTTRSLSSPTTRSQVLAQTTADESYQISQIFLGPTGGSMPVVGPSQIIRPTYRGNSTAWAPNEDYEAPRMDQA